MNKAIYLDMDGTIANFYSVPNWLKSLLSEDSTPYEIAKPLLNLSILARYLNKLQRAGYTIGIISWTSKNCSDSFAENIKRAKLEWLKRHLPSVQFDSIVVCPYGTPKSRYGLSGGYLFDDECANRQEWYSIGEPFSEKELISVLKRLA